MEKVKDAEMIRKQADSNYEEYLRLADRNAELERELGKAKGGSDRQSSFGSQSSAREEYELKSRRSTNKSD